MFRICDTPVSCMAIVCFDAAVFSCGDCVTEDIIMQPKPIVI